MSDLILPESRKSLASCAADLEGICFEIEQNDGVIPDELIKRFDDAKLELSEKTDRWIAYLDTLEALIEAKKKLKDRVAKKQKTLEALEKRLKDYLRHVMQAMPGVPYKGETGSLCLRKNPPKVEYTVSFPSRSFSNVIDKDLLDSTPSVAGYVRSNTVFVLDVEKLREDLKAGMTLPWARLVQEQRIEVKG